MSLGCEQTLGMRFGISPAPFAQVNIPHIIWQIIRRIALKEVPSCVGTLCLRGALSRKEQPRQHPEQPHKNRQNNLAAAFNTEALCLVYASQNPF